MGKPSSAHLCSRAQQELRGARNGGGEVPQRVEHRGEHERSRREHTAAPSRPLLAPCPGVHALHRMTDDSVRVSHNAIAESQCLTHLTAPSCALMASSSRGGAGTQCCAERDRCSDIRRAAQCHFCNA